MASIRLPDELQKNLVLLAAADDAKVNELYLTLQQLDATQPLEGLAEHVSRKLNQWELAVGSAMVSTLVSLCAFNAQRGGTIDETIEEVAAALEKASKIPDAKKDVILPEGAQKSLKERLKRFLSLDPLDLVAKSLGVMTDHQRAFVAARILTDIRPVFSNEISAKPTAAVIVHSLKIQYMQEGKTCEFFVALDTADLVSMQKVLTRAISKDSTLRDSFADKMRFLDPK